MGVSSQPSLVSLSLKNLLLLQGTDEEDNRNLSSSSSYGYLWSKVLAAKANKKQKIMKKRRTMMKRRSGSSRRGSNYGIQKRVRTLKRLVPNNGVRTLDGLFRETADYILSLQTRVRVMQVMVKVLTGSNEC